MDRRLKIEFLLVQNLRALLAARHLNDKDLAFATGHSQAWVSKVLSGERHMRIRDLDRVADFFGLTASQLLSPGISMLTERRRGERRRGERRTGYERRKMPPFIPE